MRGLMGSEEIESCSPRQQRPPEPAGPHPAQNTGLGSAGGTWYHAGMGRKGLGVTGERGCSPASAVLHAQCKPCSPPAQCQGRGFLG